MKKAIRIFIFFLITSCWTKSGHAHATSAPHKYQLTICAIFKNEKKYLKEWIEYHRLIGVDHFYLYNNNSSDHPLELLLPYIKTGIVTVIAWPDALAQAEEDSQMWA